jgi:magnesium-transporting ATPase (P-type)
MLIELVGFVFMSLSSILLVLIMFEYFRGLRTPTFWIYLVVAFYLSITSDLFSAAFEYPEITQMLKLASSVLIYLGISGAYQRMRTKI